MKTTLVLPIVPALLLMVMAAAFIGVALGRRTATRAPVRPGEGRLGGVAAVLWGIIATLFLTGLALGMGILVSLKVLPHFGLGRPGQPMASSATRLHSVLPLDPIAQQLETIERDLERQMSGIGHLDRDGAAVGPALEELRKRIQADRQYIEYLLKQSELTRTNIAFREAAAEAERRLREGMGRLRTLEQDVETQKRQAEMMARRAYESALGSTPSTATSPQTEPEPEPPAPPAQAEAPEPAPAGEPQQSATP